MASYNPGDVVVFLSPDVQGLKRRPGIIVSTVAYEAHRPDAVIGLVTARTHRPLTPMDHLILDWRQAGLRKPSLFRSYLTTRPRTELTLIGHLSDRDWQGIQSCLRSAIAVTGIP